MPGHVAAKSEAQKKNPCRATLRADRENKNLLHFFLKKYRKQDVEFQTIDCKNVVVGI
jgi:hypothetical protein